MFENLTGQARVWLRERRERNAEKKAAKPRTPEGAAPMLWIWFLVFVAATALLGSTWMLIVFVAGSVGHVDWTFDWRNGSDGVRRNTWSAEANVHALIGVGLFLASAAVAAYNAVWLHVRHYINGLFKTVVTGIGVFVALFMISGAIVVQQWGTDDRTRDTVAATQTAQAGIAAIDATIGSAETEMARLCAPSLTTWQAQACRSGEQAWNDRIAIARTQLRANDPNLQIIVRAIADARQGDRWRTQLTQLRAQRAAQAVTTVQASVQSVQATGWFAQFSHVLEDLRKPFIAVLGELLAMTMFGVALAALRSRYASMSVAGSGWADEAHRIEDHSDEDPLPVDPAGVRLQTVMREEDLETGEVKVKVTPAPHWRTVKKGRKQKVSITPDLPPEERGAPAGLDGGDGGDRSAALHGEHEPLLTADVNEVTPNAEENDGERPADSSGNGQNQLRNDIGRPEAQGHRAENEGSTEHAGDNVPSGFVSSIPIDHPEISDDEAAALMAAAGEGLLSPEVVDEEAVGGPVVFAGDEQAIDAPQAQDGQQQEEASASEDDTSLEEPQDVVEDDAQHDAAAPAGEDDGLTQAFASARQRPETNPARLLETMEQ